MYDQISKNSFIGTIIKAHYFALIKPPKEITVHF